MVDPFDRLHLNVIALVVELLNPGDIIGLQRVSRNWNDILGSEHIARVALLAHFPQSPEAAELVGNNSKGKTKKVQQDNEEEKPVKRRRKHQLDRLVDKKLAPEVIGYRRAVYRLQTRALARPTKVHKYRLHHIGEKLFAATSTHIFWAEGIRNIWVQTIGEGVGGRRPLRLRYFGDTIAHLSQIAATEGGLVLVQFHEVATWALVIMAIEHLRDKVIWKINLLGAIPTGLQVTSKYFYYMINVLNPNTPPTQIYIHSLETGKVVHTAPLQPPITGGCSGVPSSYIIYPPSKPTKLFATYDVQDVQSGPWRTVVRVYSIDGNILHRFDLDRPAFDVARNRPSLSLRFSIVPGKGYGKLEKLFLVESTSHSHLCRQELCTHVSNVHTNNPSMSAWVIDPDTHEIEEVRRYFSNYAENERVPLIEDGREEIRGGEFTRLECLDAVRGISYIYYDENKKKDLLATSDEDQQPARAWYEIEGARIDSVYYEEQFSRTGLPICDTHISVPSYSQSPQHPVSLLNSSMQSQWDWIPFLPSHQSTYPSPLCSPSHPGCAAENKTQPIRKPVLRHFFQTSRHKLVQPDIMRRRRRHNLGEEEEDWQLMPAKTGPLILMGTNRGDEIADDGRFVFLLAKCSGWSITCFGEYPSSHVMRNT